MTPTFGAHSSGTVAAAQAFTHTVAAGSNTALLALVLSSGTTTGVTYNGISMTKLAGYLYSGSFPLEIYGLLSPSTGTNNVLTAGSGSFWVSALSYSGVASFGNASAPGSAASVTSSTGDATVFLASALDSGFTSRGVFPFSSWAVEEGAGAPTVSTANGFMGVNLVAVGGGGPAPSTTNFAGFF